MEIRKVTLKKKGVFTVASSLTFLNFPLPTKASRQIH